MRKVFSLFVALIVFLQSFSQTVIKDSIEIDKGWWSRMVQKYPGFHGMNNRWMEKADFNKDGKTDVLLAFASVGNADTLTALGKLYYNTPNNGYIYYLLYL